jgi:serine/threonine protein kinase
MDGYELPARPFFINRDTQTKLFQGISKKRNLPIVAKCHEIQYIGKAQFTEHFNLAMNAGMAQARVEHPNTCKILELCLDVDFEKGLFSVYHILEALEKDLGKEITERNTVDRVPSEAEAKNFLVQTAQALAYAHIKNIAHRDIKPDNIFIDREGAFKVGDFGTYFEKKASMPAVTALGTLPYMSPQQRKIITGEGQDYDAFKSDVYSLGFTTLSLASVTLFERPWPLEDLKPTAQAKVQKLGYSVALTDLLLAMLE